MTIRSVDLETKEETSRPLTQEEIDASAANTAREAMEAAANIDTSDEDLQSDLAAIDASVITDPDTRAVVTAILDTLKGNGPKGAKARGRK